MTKFLENEVSEIYKITLIRKKFTINVAYLKLLLTRDDCAAQEPLPTAAQSTSVNLLLFAEQKHWTDDNRVSRVPPTGNDLTHYHSLC